MTLAQMTQAHKFVHAFDGYTEGYARLYPDGTADWYPGGSHVGCRRMANELDPIGPVYVPLEDEVFETPDDEDRVFDAVLLHIARLILDTQMDAHWPVSGRARP